MWVHVYEIFLEGLWRCEGGSLIVDLVDRRSLIVEFVKVPNRIYQSKEVKLINEIGF